MENTNIVQIRFYCEKEAFSRDFLDSLVKHYRLYRDSLLEQENNRALANIGLELALVEESLTLYEDSLHDLEKHLPVSPPKAYSLEMQNMDTVWNLPDILCRDQKNFNFS